MPSPSNQQPPQPQPKPQSEPTPQPAAKPAPKPAARKTFPEPVFDSSHGELVSGTRYWPTDLWSNRWSLPRYRRGAAALFGIVIGAAFIASGLGEIGRWGTPISSFMRAKLSSSLSSASLALLWGLIKAGLLLSVLLLNGLWAVWWERKVSAHIQSRLGPMEAGGFHGWAQTLLDGIKLFLKEDVTPAAADSSVHLLAPAVIFVSLAISFAPVSFGRGLVYAPMDAGLLFILAVSGISAIGVVMAGWSSANKYALLGGLRAAAQIVSYELPRAFALVPVLIFAGSLDLRRIVAAQSGYWGGVLPKWFVFYPVVGQIAFLIFLISSIAETNRTPFDIPEAESELVAGFNTEFSGMKWSFFFLSEYGYVLLASYLAAACFLGGGEAPAAFLAFIPSWTWFLAKALLMMFVFLWVRWTYPRLRSDQLMDLGWKTLLPWSFANIFLAALWAGWA